MKLTEIAKTPKGTYAGVRFSDKTCDAITKYIADNNIPNAIKGHKLHATLLYSRKHLPDYKPPGMLDENLVGKPKGFKKWTSQPDDDGNVTMCLVLKFDCPELTKRHKRLMKEHGATYDFKKFKPHITLSYDVGSLQCKDLPEFTDDIEINEEYGEDLNLNWAKSNT